MSLSNIIEYQHKEHREWINKLDFYQEELKVFQKELEMVLLKYSDLYSIIEHVDEYQDIISKKLNQINAYRRQVILHERHLMDKQLAKTDELWDHAALRVQVEEFESKIEKFKKSFRRFVSKHLKR